MKNGKTWSPAEFKASNPTIKKILKGTFPAYKKRKVRVYVTDSHTEQSEGGGTFYFVSRYTFSVGKAGRCATPESGDSPHAGANYGPIEYPLTPDHALVVTGYFCGKESTASIYVAPMDQAIYDVAMDALLGGEYDDDDMPKATALLESAGFTGDELDLRLMLLCADAKEIQMAQSGKDPGPAGFSSPSYFA